MKQFIHATTTLFLTAMLQTMATAQPQPKEQPLWKSPDYTVYKDRIVQGKYTAQAISTTEITSNYKSLGTLVSPEIVFKFSINGKDNEMLPGVDHHFVCSSVSGMCEAPLIKFGQPLLLAKPAAKTAFLKPGSQLKLRLDMRDVFTAFNTKGFYTTYNGGKIYKADFKNVYVAGATAPLIWDFDNLVNHKELELKDADGDGIYEITLQFNEKQEDKQTADHWSLSKDISAFPQYTSGFALSDAIYNLSLEEMTNAIEADSTFRTGKEWAGVWTRDISYSIILSMAYLQPQVAKNSLLRKVSKKRKIIQDTGTGGAWPVSTDRMIWAVAAWELYKATGDQDWLQEAFGIIRNSLADDYYNVYDKKTGLVKGESSFLDWREQTYPKWMQPADIFESGNLGTNVVHYQANVIMSKMAAALGRRTDIEKYASAATEIKNAINRYLWLPSQKYYAQYVYGRLGKMVSPRSEALGEALAILFDVADARQQQGIMSNTPQTGFGIPCIFPQIPGIPPYHNNAVWPFVQSYWLWAAAKMGNEAAVMESISAIYRPAALFLTNKENFVATDGDFLGTQINSSNMLWSLAGNISIVHKVFFGMRFYEDGLAFLPFIPKVYGGTRKLTNFKYRGAVLDIELEGYGNTIQSFLIDGKQDDNLMFPATLTGPHTISIKMGNIDISPAPITKVANRVSLAAPLVTYNNYNLQWAPVAGASAYEIYKNGELYGSVSTTTFPVVPSGMSDYAVTAIDRAGSPSFSSEPIMVAAADSSVVLYQAEDVSMADTSKYQGFTGTGFVETTDNKHTRIRFNVSVPVDGNYNIDCRYANGNGPVNTENKCAVRTIKDNSVVLGVIVLPQRGTNEWSNWGFSSSVKVFLTKGEHKLTLEYLPINDNMNLEINQAMIDYLRVGKIGE